MMAMTSNDTAVMHSTASTFKSNGEAFTSEASAIKSTLDAIVEALKAVLPFQTVLPALEFMRLLFAAA